MGREKAFEELSQCRGAGLPKEMQKEEDELVPIVPRRYRAIANVRGGPPNDLRLTSYKREIRAFMFCMPYLSNC